MNLTYYGQSCFLVQVNNKKILFDPFIKPNPQAKHIDISDIKADYIFLSHGHGDHTADVVTVARSTNAQVVAPFELSVIFQQRGLKNVVGMNPGGTLKAHGLSITMVPAVHSSSIEDDGKNIYAGLATGYVIGFEDGLVAYYAGDTSIFSDMKLIGELYRPSLAFLPIGDLFTMGPEQAAAACGLLGVKQVMPMHWGTFPALTGTPARLRELVASKGVEVLDLKPGETSE